jgi:hypothetical protein
MIVSQPRTVLSRWGGIAAVAVIAGCGAPRAGMPQSLDLRTELDSKGVMERSLMSLVQLRGDSVVGRLIMTGQLQATNVCTRLTLDVLHASRWELTLALTRHPPTDPCFAVEGSLVFTGAVYPLAAGSYRVRVEDRLLRSGGGVLVLDTLAETTVEVK